MKALNKLTDSYLVVVLIALAVGILLSKQVIVLAPYVTVFLGAIFFLSSLKIELKDVARHLKDTKVLLTVNIFMLILFPLVVYLVVKAIAPSLALPFLILAAMPAGMTAPLLSEISGGRQNLALVLTVTTSLLAPITVPLMIKWLAGAAVMVSFFDMFLSLAKVIFIPFILAQIIKYYWEKKIEPFEYTFKPVSVILLMLLIMGVVAKQADTLIEGFRTGQSIFYLLSLFVFFIVIHFAGYFSAFWKHKKDRITITVCLTYMNFTLAIYLADRFFTASEVIIPVVLSVIPWALLLPLFKYITSRRAVA